MSSTIGKVITCRAAISRKEGSPLTIETITVDPPLKGEVRVKMVTAGICHSDAHFVWGHTIDFEIHSGQPVILGHEGSGIVESVGDDVTSVKAGDHVIPLWMINCGKCLLCNDNPKTNLCMAGNITSVMTMKDGTSRAKLNGDSIMIMAGTGCFSEYQVLREDSIAKINSKASLDKISVIGCAVGTGYGSAINLAKVYSGSTCAIWGLGAIGLSVALGCKASGAKRIIGIDINSDKFEIAKKFGCNEFINPNELDKPLEEIFQSTGGIDYGFDCVGNVSILQTVASSLSGWGTLVAIGLAAKGGVMSIPVIKLLMGQTMVGGFFGGYKPRNGVQSMVEMYTNGKLPIDDLVTHRIKLDDINKGFDLLKKGESIRTIIEF